MKSLHPDLKYKNGRLKIKRLDPSLLCSFIRRYHSTREDWTRIDPILGKDGLYMSGNFEWVEFQGRAYKYLYGTEMSFDSRYLLRCDRPIRERTYNALMTIRNEGYPLTEDQLLDCYFFKSYKDRSCHIGYFKY